MADQKVRDSKEEIKKTKIQKKIREGPRKLTRRME